MTDQRSDPPGLGTRQPWSWPLFGAGLLLVALVAAVAPVSTTDSSCGQVLWNAHWDSPVCDGIRRQAVIAGALGAAGLAVVLVASRRRGLALVACGALLGAVATVNRLAEASEAPTHCGSLLNRVVFERDPALNAACDDQLDGRRRQAAAAGAVTVGLIAWGARLSIRGSRLMRGTDRRPRPSDPGGVASGAAPGPRLPTGDGRLGT